MWEHPATQENVDRLRRRGVELLGPEEGDLAEGEHGPGRMTEPEDIFARCLVELRASAQLEGKRVLVTAGGTKEPLDLVRYLGNRSSGKMGVALAREARRRGAEVTLVAANLAVPAPVGVELVRAPTAAELAREVLDRDDADIVVMAAAVADYRPSEPVAGKRTKEGEPWSVTLEPTPDVLAELGRRRRDGQILVGFAADAGEGGLERAREKLANKKGNLFVYNDVSRTDVGFESDENEVVLISARGERRVGRRSKEACAVVILDEIGALLPAASWRTSGR
jgi:phosphopantothenoylcysteine decarboxylase/phosphopantothenate--cysteine ligase